MKELIYLYFNFHVKNYSDTFLGQNKNKILLNLYKIQK
jgi:hypothetical protein